MCWGETAQPQQKAAAFPSLRESSHFVCPYRGAGAITGLSLFSTTAALPQRFHHLSLSWNVYTFWIVQQFLLKLVTALPLLRFHPYVMYGSERGTCLKPSLQTAFLFFLVYCCCSNRAESCRRKTLSPLGQNQRGVSQNRCESEYFHFYFHSPWQGGQRLPWHHSCYVLF